MPIQKFSDSSPEAKIDLTGKRTIRLLSTIFSKGFEQTDYLSLLLSFSEQSPLECTLNFKSISVITDEKINSLVFYRGNGAVYSVPSQCREVYLKVLSQKNIDYEFVLTYDFYPGSI